jgi:hypothetical protein
MGKETEFIMDLDERQTQFHLVERIDRSQIDKYPVLKRLLEMAAAGAQLDPEAKRQLRRIQWAATNEA